MPLANLCTQEAGLIIHQLNRLTIASSEDLVTQPASTGLGPVAFAWLRAAGAVSVAPVEVSTAALVAVLECRKGVSVLAASVKRRDQRIEDVRSWGCSCH